MAVNETGAISISGLQSPSKWIHSFLIEVYSDVGLTTLVARKQPLFKWNEPTLTNLQQEISTIAGLTWGDTYYVRVGSVTPVTGKVNWSSTVAVQAGDQVIGSPNITAPFSHTEVAGEYLSGYDATTGLFDVGDIDDLVPSQTGNSGKVLTTNGSVVSWGTQPWTASIWFPDISSGRQVWVYEGSSDYTVTFPSGLTHWKARVGTNPTATATFSFKKATFSGGSWGTPTEFGTLQISTGGAFTWASASGASIGNNEAFVIDEPSDSTLANVNITAKGTR